MPSASSGALSKQGRPVQNMWYSFDVAGVHFVSVSTETDFPHRLTQAPYLVEALAEDSVTNCPG